MQDLETVQQVINGQQIPATTYVFFETGQSPLREQIRIDLPLFLITPSVPYTGAAFPKLKYRSDYISALNISYSGKPEAALLLSNMDAVVAHEFKNELPTIITKTLIASAMNQADLRTWTSLPKEFHFCRFPTPADRKIELESPFSGYKLPVSINDGLINVVWVKSVNRNSPLAVMQFKLKDEVKTIVQTETIASQNISQAAVPKSEQATQKNEAEIPTSENQPETSMPSQ